MKTGLLVFFAAIVAFPVVGFMSLLVVSSILALPVPTNRQIVSIGPGWCLMYLALAIAGGIAGIRLVS